MTTISPIPVLARNPTAANRTYTPAVSPAPGLRVVSRHHPIAATTVAAAKLNDQDQ
jgi:hypothetical protein